MAQTATSYYHGIFTPPSSPNGVIKQGVIADVTGATAPTTAASVTYTPPSGAGIDTLIINGLPLDITYNTSATQTVTDAKTALANGGTAVNTTTVGSLALTGYASKALLATGTTTLVLTAKAPGTAGEGISVFLVHKSGANTGSLNRSFTGGASRWFGQGVGAGVTDGAILGGCGALQTGIGYSTQTSPVKARTSSNVGTTAATATWTPPTSSTATLNVAGQWFTISFNSSAAQTVTDAIATLHANPKVAREVVASNDGSDKLLLTAAAGIDGNNIQISAGAENGSTLDSAFTGGAGPTVTDVSSPQVGAGLDAQHPLAFTALRVTPCGTSTQGDTAAGTVNAVGATDAVLVTSSCTYTPPTSSIDYLFINGHPLEVLTAAGTGTANAVNYETSATITSDHIRTAIQAIPWLNDLLVVGGTTTVTLTSRYKDTTPGTPVAGLGPWGNAVTVFSSGLNSASVNHADLTGGATSAKGVRLVASTGTVANGGAVITGWLNEFNPGSSGNPNTGSIATGFVVTGRAS